jgi:hypothetical protein
LLSLNGGGDRARWRRVFFSLCGADNKDHVNIDLSDDLCRWCRARRRSLASRFL